MKTITKSLKMLILAVLLFGIKTSSAQCLASFTHSVGANGNVTFTSTSITSSVNTTYYWTFGPGIPTFTGMGSVGMFPTYNYTANGTYTVTLFILSTSPTCSTSTSAVVVVNTVGGCGLVANFTSAQGANGLVNFNNTSTGTVGATSYNWAFGDGGTSTATSPAHTYTANGTYIATLTANNNGTTSCVSTKTLAINVNSNCTLNANFTYSYNANGNVQFFNLTTSTVGVAYSWNFGNTVTSNLTNPFSVTYAANGTYTVTLIATSFTPACTSTFTAVVTVTNVTGCNLSANFVASNGGNGLINFINTSTGTSSTTTYSWAFGNGQTSNSTNASTTYTANGVYQVTLVASNNSTPSCVSTKTLTINMNAVCNLVAGFNYTVGNNGVTQFVSTSTGTSGATMYNWTFGGGNGTSTQINPTKTFANGTYIVTLTVSNVSTTCSNSTTQTITVTNNTCIANANFTLLPTNTPKFWNAIPANTANIAAAQWNWGDGNTSNTLFTSHLYSVSATYTICLSVTLTCGSSANYCTTYFIFKPTAGSTANDEMIRIDVLAEQNTTGLTAINKDAAIVNLFPNPNSGSFKLNASGLANDGTNKVTVTNLLGDVIYTMDAKANNGEINTEVNLGQVAGGIYFVKIESGNSSSVQKLIINR